MDNGMKIAYVFPGQGSQEVRMGLNLYNQYKSAKGIFDKADKILGYSISELCFNGPEEDLTKTVNVQPAILTVSIACLEAAKEIAGNKLPLSEFVAGHSIGEYSAMVAAGILDFGDAIKLVSERGKLMHEAALNNPGAMMAILGTDEEVVKEICTKTNTEISNINSPGQVVISGSKENIAQAKIEAELKGIRRIIPLRVSGAFHSRLMQSASEGLGLALDSIHFNSSSVRLISNLTGEAIPENGDIKRELTDQVIKCVQWQKSVETLISNGVTCFIEFGHGQVLTNLIKRINTSVSVYNIGDNDTINQINAIINN